MNHSGIFLKVILTLEFFRIIASLIEKNKPVTDGQYLVIIAA
jgi:hypothetical protein